MILCAGKYPCRLHGSPLPALLFPIPPLRSNCLSMIDSGIVFLTGDVLRRRFQGLQSFELTRQVWSVSGSLFAMESGICRARCFAISSRFGGRTIVIHDQRGRSGVYFSLLFRGFSEGREAFLQGETPGSVLPTGMNFSSRQFAVPRSFWTFSSIIALIFGVSRAIR